MSDTTRENPAGTQVAECALSADEIAPAQREFAEALGEALVDQWLTEHPTKSTDCRLEKDS